MKRLITIIVAITTLIACNQTNVKTTLFEDGSVKSEKTYKTVNGQEQITKEISFHPNGKKYIEGHYKDGLRDGYWASWYNDGQLWSEGNFKQDKSDGERSVYHPNGTLHYKGTFNTGKRVGIWTYYDETGVKVNEINYNESPELPD